MKLLFYGAKRNLGTKKLLRMIERLLPSKNLEIYSTFDDLAGRLCQPTNDSKFAVLTATNKDELQGIVSLGELLSDIRTVLILPDRDRNTISKAHTLAPRFIAYVDSDFEELQVVLSKMFESLKWTRGQAGDSLRMYGRS